MSYTVCNTVTHPVSDNVTNVVRTSVQNQNQNQRFWLRLLVVVLGEAIHPSLRPVRSPRPHMDDACGVIGGGL